MVLDRREAMSILKYIKIILVLLFKAYLVYLWINFVETFTQLLYYIYIESIFIGAVRPISILSLW